MVVLPARHGGLSFDHPAKSLEYTANLSNQIATGSSDLLCNIELDQVAKSIGRQRYKIALEATAADIQARLPPPQQRAMSLAREKGGSSTLTTMPIAEHGFYFHVKSDFHDHIRLRYCWPLDNLPVSCPCGARFNVDHAQVCKLSGFIHVRHKKCVAYSRVVSWLRCLSFSLARSAIWCIRGSRSVRRQTFILAPVDLVQAEARLIRI